MTILQDVRFVNASRSGNDCYINEHWVCLPHLRVAIKIKRYDGYGGDDEWSSVTYESIDSDMPQEVQDWFLNNQND